MMVTRIARPVVQAFVAFVFVISPPAKAEVIWEDSSDLEMRMDTTMREILPATCVPSPNEAPESDDPANRSALIGYNQAYSFEPSIIRYEVVVHITKQCFDLAEARLDQMVKEKKPIFSNKVAQSLEAYYDADGGPTFILQFKVAKRESDRVAQ
ncbi:hypothetical protein [Sphingomonas sp. IC4-52]|uniref:hypothetical protein n=1 Tax=Sphingomonas sp. IC4-52 TaxID=2887202 RepID=UPI001D1204F5|nr:hypothetical protein [Sphingomonas sp. IC4-52]MCC2978888.1 hypothetical protein [Sphingomonas sp. IC4-52]